MGLKLMHASDIHYCDKHLDEVDRCTSFAVNKAIEAGVDAFVFTGDFFDHRLDLHSPPVAAALYQVQRAANHAPVIILQGTYSHDVPGSLDVFKTVGGWYPVFVADRIGQVALTKDPSTEEYQWAPSEGWIFDTLPAHTIALFSCLPSVNKGAVAAVVGAENAAKEVGEQVYKLLAGWSVSNTAARQDGITTVVLSHGTVSGSVTEHGCPMAGLDHEFTTGSLFASEASAIMLGHIHKMQHFSMETPHRRHIAYAGSVGCLHYGENDPKGFLVWEVDYNGSEFEFVPTPSKRLIDIDCKGPPDMDLLLAESARAIGAHVRIRYQIDEEHRHSVDKAAILALFDGIAAEVKIEGRINPIQRTRAEGMNQTQSLDEKLVKWAEVTETAPDPLVERMQLLERMSPEQIVDQVLNDPAKEDAA